MQTTGKNKPIFSPFHKFQMDRIRQIGNLKDIISEQMVEQMPSQNSRSYVREKCGNKDTPVWLTLMSS